MTDAFLYRRKDAFGNVFVLCPVCGSSYKLDGIRHHIQLQARQEGDVAHKKWLKEHPWNFGTRTPAKAQMRP